MKIICPKCESENVEIVYPEKRVTLDVIANRSNQLTVAQKGTAIGRCLEPECGYTVTRKEWER